MEMTHSNHPTRPARPPRWWEAVIIATTSGALALPGYALWRSVTTCGEGLECLLNLPIAGAFSVVVAPVTAWVVWGLCGIPRPFLLGVVTVAIGHVMAVSVANGFGEEFGGAEAPIGQTVLAPAAVYVLIGVVSGLAAMVLVWRGTWSRRVRVGVVVLIALLSFAAHARDSRVAVQQQEDRLRAVGVTIYLPDISDRVTPWEASTFGVGLSDGAPQISVSYRYKPAQGANLDGPILTLLATTDGGCGDAVRAGLLPEGTCRKTADGFVAHDPTGTGAHYVGVTRGQTMLVLWFPRSSFDDTQIADSLRHAPQVSVADLARL